MAKEPILGRVNYIEDGRNMHLVIKGGLHYIRGNKAPHFSLTADILRQATFSKDRWQDIGGGCCHDLILQHRPDLADLASLHLSDIDGKPSHAVANGWYWMAGALGGAGEQHHGANHDTYGRVADPVADSLRIFSEHVRIPLPEAEALRDLLKPHIEDANKERSERRTQIVAEYGPLTGELRDYGDVARYFAARGEGDRTAKAVFETWFAKQVERWKAEADACIKKHGLVVYGDAWEAAV